MSDKISYWFKLRDDMPPGFQDNERYPELPAIYTYLSQFNNQEFDSIEDFNSKVLDNFLPYLEEQGIPKGSDPSLREGLRTEELQERYEGKSGRFDYWVFTPADDSHARKCVFGGLERVEK